jgi:hypothetical protein
LARASRLWEPLRVSLQESRLSARRLRLSLELWVQASTWSIVE